MSAQIKLASRLDSTAAFALAEKLKTNRGNPLELDASDVTFAGALTLQVLIAANRQWTTEGLDFRISNSSEAIKSACEALGIPESEFGARIEPNLEALT